MNYKSILFILLIVCFSQYVSPKSAAAVAEDKTKALVGAGVATLAVDATAHYAGNYHGVFHCPVIVFPVALAAIIGFHRLYAGDWKLLQHLLESCGFSRNIKSVAPDCENNDFAGGGDEAGSCSSDDVADSGDCCGGCCSC